MIMHDPVQGKGLHSILNDLLTERAYGRVVEDAHGEKQWVWNGGNVAAAADAADSSSVGDQDAPVSYGRFLRAKVRFVETPASPCWTANAMSATNAPFGFASPHAVPHVGRSCDCEAE